MTSRRRGKVLLFELDQLERTRAGALDPGLDALVRLLDRHPETASPDPATGGARRWLVVDRTFRCPNADPEGWDLEFHLVDATGLPACIRICREITVPTVVGYDSRQPVLDPSAPPPAQFLRNLFEWRCDRLGIAPARAMREAFGGPVDPEALWSAANAYLTGHTLPHLQFDEDLKFECLAFFFDEIDPAQLELEQE